MSIDIVFSVYFWILKVTNRDQWKMSGGFKGIWKSASMLGFTHVMEWTKRTGLDLTKCHHVTNHGHVVKKDFFFQIFLEEEYSIHLKMKDHKDLIEEENIGKIITKSQIK